MANKGFGSELFRNMQSIKANGKDGIVFPVKANGKVGIVFGLPRAKHESKPPSKKFGILARLKSRVSSR